jgi:ATP-dependent Zn protease
MNANLSFSAKSLNGSAWSGAIDGPIKKCLREQFQKGAIEVIVNDNGIKTTYTDASQIERIQESAKIKSSKRWIFRLIFWAMALIIISGFGLYVFTNNAGKTAVLGKATKLLDNKETEGTLLVEIKGIEYDQDLYYLYDLVVNDQVVMKARYGVMNGTIAISK